MKPKDSVTLERGHLSLFRYPTRGNGTYLGRGVMVQILTILAIQGGSPSPFDRSLATKVPINDGSLKSFLLQMLDNCKHIFHYTDFALTAWGKGS